jgi:hypothetical protein
MYAIMEKLIWEKNNYGQKLFIQNEIVMILFILNTKLIQNFHSV